jgi:hypothetical protein
MRRLKDEKTEEERKQYEQELKEQFENGEIGEAEYKTLVSVPTQKEEILLNPEMYIPVADNPYANPDDFMDESALEEAVDLTEEDKLYLATK